MRSGIIIASAYISKSPQGNGNQLVCLISHTDYLGTVWTEAKNIPNDADFNQALADSAVAYADSLVANEAGDFANFVLWAQPYDDVAVPLDADLKYAQRVEVAAALRVQYPGAQYSQLINTAAALYSLTVPELETAFGVSDASEIVTRITRQKNIRDSLANEAGE